VDLKAIRYFVQIAELGSLTRAAQHLHVAQPALSRHIHALEAELGAALLVRMPRGVRLTTPGRQFLDHCRRVLRELDRAQDALRSGSAFAQGQVILGVSPTTGPLLLPGLTLRMRRQCPQIGLKVVEGFSDQLHDWLQSGRADVAILTNPVASRMVKVTPLISEPVVMIESPAMAPATRLYTVEQLGQTPVISTESIRIIVDEQLQRYGTRVRVEAEIDSVEAIHRLAQAGISRALMPVSTFHEDLLAQRLLASPVADASIHRILTLGQPAERQPTAAIEEVAQIVAAEIRELAERGVFDLPGPGSPSAQPSLSSSIKEQE